MLEQVANDQEKPSPQAVLSIGEYCTVSSLVY